MEKSEFENINTLPDLVQDSEKGPQDSFPPLGQYYFDDLNLLSEDPPETKGFILSDTQKSMLSQLQGIGARKMAPVSPLVILKHRAQDKNLDQRHARMTKEITEYKERMVRNKKALASTIFYLGAIIRTHPDISNEELHKIFQDTLPASRLTREQVNIINLGIGEYIKKHQQLRKVQQQYPDEVSLFKTAFGKEPAGKIEIRWGPITCHVICHSSSDFSYLYHGKFDGVSNDSDLAGQKAGGFYLQDITTRIPALQDAVTVYRVLPRGTYFFIEPDKVFDHEEQHAIVHFFDKVRKNYVIGGPGRVSIATRSQTYARRFPRPYYLHDEAKKLKNDSERAELVRETVAPALRYAELKGRSEALAHLRDGASAQQARTTILTLDYLSVNWQSWLTHTLTQDLGDGYKHLIQDALEKLKRKFRIDTYKAALALIKMEKTGYSKQDMVNLLINEPFRKWTKVAERIADEDKKKVIS